MSFPMEDTVVTSKEIAALDKKIEALKLKLYKAKEVYDSLADQMSSLLEQRYPERKEKAIKDRLYEAYRNSGKIVDFIIDFNKNVDDEDDFWS